MSGRGRSGRPPGGEGGLNTGECEDALERPSASGGQAPTSPPGTRRDKGKDEIKNESDYDLIRKDDDDDLDDLLAIDLHEELEKILFMRPPVKLPVLNNHNYYVWAQTHKRFFRGRGMFRIVSGSQERPRERQAARRWTQLDRWIATMMSRNVGDTQKTHIVHLTKSKDIWDTLRRVHVASGKGHLVAMLQKFYGYVKSADQTIDQMVSDLRRLRDEIEDLEPTAAPANILAAAVIMNACKGSEYDMAKYVLSMKDHLTVELVVDHLRSVEPDKMAEESSPLARKGRKK